MLLMECLSPALITEVKAAILASGNILHAIVIVPDLAPVAFGAEADEHLSPYPPSLPAKRLMPDRQAVEVRG